MRSIDFNCDMGEGGGSDAELMKYISSANIACGFHAGDPTTMSETIRLAVDYGVAIGAHPGYRDSENFGRQPISMSPNEVFGIVIDQIAVLNDLCSIAGAKLHHVKPHGALYNQAAKNAELASAIAEAVATTDKNLILYGLSGSFLISAAETAGLKTASEVFADRTYRSDGSLTARTDAFALITDVEYAVRQVFEMVATGHVTAVTGEVVPIRADTVCIHGDGENAASFAKQILDVLTLRGIEIGAP